MTEIHRFRTEEELARASADFIVHKGEQAIHSHGRFNLALTGSFSALDTYRNLPGAASGASMNWPHVYLFWSDERCVPATDPASHYRMIHTNLISRVAIPDGNVHPIICGENPKEESHEYEDLLRAHFLSQSRPCFDLILLGLGTDGHVASLFPQTESLYEKQRWVIADFIPSLGEWRMTLTAEAINQAACVAFITRGKEKSEALHQSLQGERRQPTWPASFIQPADGEIHWFVDEAAAVLI